MEITAVIVILKSYQLVAASVALPAWPCRSRRRPSARRAKDQTCASDKDPGCKCHSLAPQEQNIPNLETPAHQEIVRNTNFFRYETLKTKGKGMPFTRSYTSRNQPHTFNVRIPPSPALALQVASSFNSMCILHRI